LGKYLGSISRKNLRVITGEIFVGYFGEDFEFRASLRKFQDLNFWDATHCQSRLNMQAPENPRVTEATCPIKGLRKDKGW
jgi:hypothetical protein